MADKTDYYVTAKGHQSHSFSKRPVALAYVQTLFNRGADKVEMKVTHIKDGSPGAGDIVSEPRIEKFNAKKHSGKL